MHDDNDDLVSLEPGVPNTLDLSSAARPPGEIVWRGGGQLGMKFHSTAKDAAKRAGNIVEAKPGK